MHTIPIYSGVGIHSHNECVVVDDRLAKGIGNIVTRNAHHYDHHQFCKSTTDRRCVICKPF